MRIPPYSGYLIAACIFGIPDRMQRIRKITDKIMRTRFYKYRSLEPFEYVADILINERFYASTYDRLNDPMEGLYRASSDISEEVIKEIGMAKEKLKILSLSSDFESPLLWAYYASGFSGICIEVDVSGIPIHDIVEVEYSKTNELFSAKDLAQVKEFPRKLLSAKAAPWVHESEYRVFSLSAFVQEGIKISRILLGARISPDMARVIIRLVGSRFPVHLTKINRKKGVVSISKQVRNELEFSENFMFP